MISMAITIYHDLTRGIKKHYTGTYMWYLHPARRTIIKQRVLGPSPSAGTVLSISHVLSFETDKAPILQMSRLRHRVVTEFIQIAQCKWPNKDSSPGGLSLVYAPNCLSLHYLKGSARKA